MKNFIFNSPAAKLAGEAMQANSISLVTDNWLVREGEGVVFIKGSHKWGRKFMPLSFAGTGQKAALQESYEPTPDFTENLADYDVLEFDLDPGDCLIFDSHTLHGAPNPVPPERTVNRLTLRFAHGNAAFEKRGSWTDAQTEYWQAHEMKEGELIVGDLLPLVWSQ